MGTEIERKFLLKGDGWRALAKGTPYRQGYLNSAKERTVRIRTVGNKANNMFEVTLANAEDLARVTRNLRRVAGVKDVRRLFG